MYILCDGPVTDIANGTWNLKVSGSITTSWTIAFGSISFILSFLFSFFSIYRSKHLHKMSSLLVHFCLNHFQSNHLKILHTINQHYVTNKNKKIGFTSMM